MNPGEEVWWSNPHGYHGYRKPMKVLFVADIPPVSPHMIGRQESVVFIPQMHRAVVVSRHRLSKTDTKCYALYRFGSVSIICDRPLEYGKPHQEHQAHLNRTENAVLSWRTKQW